MCVTEAEATGRAVAARLGGQARATASSARRSPSSACALLGRPAIGARRPRRRRRRRRRARLPLVAPVHDRRGHLADPAQPDRRAHPRHAEGPLTEPRGRSASSRSPQTDERRRAAAAGHRRWCSRSRATTPAVDRADRRPRSAPRRRSAARVPRRPAPRGSARPPRATAASTSTTRATSARTTRASPSTRSRSTATGATGTVDVPDRLRGPARASCTAGSSRVFFDCVVQHHNCDVGRGRQDHLARACATGGRRRCSTALALRGRARRRRAAASRSTGAAAVDGDACCARPRCDAVAGDRAAPARGLAPAEPRRDAPR